MAGRAPGRGNGMKKIVSDRLRFSPIQWLILALLAALIVLVVALSFWILRLPPPLAIAASSATPLPTFTSATSSPEPSLTPQTAIVNITPTPIVYTVQQGDTLFGIAAKFNVSVEEIKAVNALTSDMIFIGQMLVIPVSAEILAVSPSLDTSSSDRYMVQNGDTIESIAQEFGISENALRTMNFMAGDTLLDGQFIQIPASGQEFPPRTWRFSTIDGDTKTGYPLSLETGRFTLHYQPDTFPAQDPEALARLELSALAFLESRLGLTFSYPFDVYVAGRNFESPNLALRGRGTSVLFRTFFLHDGTGNPDDQLYLVTHELTHLLTWHSFGSPSSTMISEGTAVYLGMEHIPQSGHMPIETFCASYLKANSLPSISSSQTTYLGHINDLQNYYAAGCFVKFLVDTYGIESLKLVYHDGSYLNVYGKDLYALESDWRVHLRTIEIPASLNPVELVGAVKDLENSYASFFASFTGTPSQMERYRNLDKARIALLEGNIYEMRNFLNY
jgi:LysM repeat protein